MAIQFDIHLLNPGIGGRHQTQAGNRHYLILPRGMALPLSSFSFLIKKTKGLNLIFSKAP